MAGASNPFAQFADGTILDAEDGSSWIIQKGKRMPYHEGVADQQGFSDQRALLDRVDRADAALKAHPMAGSGLWAAAAHFWPGSVSNRIQTDLLPIQSNARINNMMRLKEASKTGATGLGGMSNKEGQTLETTDSNLSIYEPSDQLRQELKATRDAYGRRTKGLTKDNPYDLATDSPAIIPQGAYFRAHDGNVYLNKSSAGAPGAPPPAGVPPAVSGRQALKAAPRVNAPKTLTYNPKTGMLE